MDIHEHFKKLYEETKEIDMWYAPAYNREDGGRMTAIGYRSDDPDPIIDGVVWMLYAQTAVNVQKSKSITNINELEATKEDLINIIVHAQAIVSGMIVSVHLGTYNVINTRFAGKNGYRTFHLRRMGT